ncbi:hypothetical protein [Yinghuangia seranimata]|uniref:hypothetical protein n=1 Tax=Yinghuangia seranimata TaxID=408067 RepID=UPI00248BFB33|nr:hypothetical protein [Yinghuangia seranimata]MDI2126506.1 hypothetical protein [Yinghuangia seranimata]
MTYDETGPPGPQRPEAASEASATPDTGLDAVRRLHVMAAGIPGARVVEGVLDAEFADVWAVMSDLEGGFGEFQPDMRNVRVTARDGDRVTAHARSRYGMRARLDGVVRPGWCWLQSRFVIIGMAAEPLPDGAGTRVALTGGLRIPGRALIVPGAGRELRRSLDRLTRRMD